MGPRGGRSKSPGQRKKKQTLAKKQSKSPDSASREMGGKSSKVVHTDSERPALSQPKKKKTEPQEEDPSTDEEDLKQMEDDSESEDESSSDHEEEESATEEEDGGKEIPPKGKLFSDQNSKWLKPKKEKLLSSDEEGDNNDEMPDDDDSDDDDDDDDDEEMEIERESRLLDARREEEEEEAEEELRETVAKNTAVYHLPTAEELEQDVDRVVPPSELRSRIDSILGVLADFKQQREPGRPRSEYIERLAGFIAELYGYLPELVEYFLTMFSPAEALEFIEYSDKQRPMVIRTNTLKTRRKDLALALMKRGVTLDPLASWSKVGLKITESPVPIGATPEYLSGHYMLQSAASMCPVLALAPEPKERVLDMSAAPGGKTSYIAQLMRNTGVVFANDLKPDRQKATVANMHRLGVKNVVTCTHDGRKMPKLFQHYKFDRVLLDAPCSGLGVISRDPSCKVQRTIADVNKTAHLQKELLLAAIDMLNHKSKTGGVMVYSTCSVSVAENEEVVNYALSKRDIKIIDTGLDFGRPGFTRYQQKRFHPSIAKTRRFYPHVHNMDGFFVCKIMKLSDGSPTVDMAESGTEREPIAKDNEEKKAIDEPTGKPIERSKLGKQTKGKKRSAVEKSMPRKKSKADKVSVPPAGPKPKKSTRSAKMLKPRRVKPEKVV